MAEQSSRNPNRSLAGVAHRAVYSARMGGNMKLTYVALFACGLVLAAAQSGGKPELSLQKAIQTEMVDGDLKGAIDQYKKLAQGKDRAVAAKALIHMGQCYERMGDAEARQTYERVVRDFADQKEEVAEARTHLAATGARREKGLDLKQIGAKLGDRRYGPAVSQDGRYIAYSGQGAIFVHDLVTGEQRQVMGERLSEKESFSSPIISPDGRSVACAGSAAGAGPELYVVGADGSNPRLLGKGYSAIPRAWSPDGKHILAMLLAPTAQRALVSVADGSFKEIGTGALLDAQFSPDGAQIALTKFMGAGRTDIVLIPADGGAEIPIVENAGRNGSPAWAPDGKRLLFLSDRQGSTDLWSIRLADGRAAGSAELVKDRIDNLLGVSHDGGCYYQTGTIARELYVAGIDPQTGKPVGTPKQITSRGLTGGAAWSPDGENLAYYAMPIRQGDAATRVVIRSTRTGGERELSPKEPLNLYSWYPQWFPDSRSLFVHSRDGKLRQLDVRTGEYRPLLAGVTISPYRDGAANPQYQAYVILSPDGRSIYYQVRDQEAQQIRILRRDLQGGPEKELCRVRADLVRGLSVSRDGGQLVFVERWQGETGDRKPSWAIVTLSAGGGEPKEVYRSSPQWGDAVVWSKDGHRVFFKLQGGDIYSIPAEGGSPQPLGIGLHSPYFLSLNPDGTQFVFTDEQWNNQLWVLKNLFGEASAAR